MTVTNNKYTALLIFIGLFILSLALIDGVGLKSLLVSLIFLSVIVLIIRKLQINQNFFILYVGGSVLGFLFDIICSLNLVPEIRVFVNLGRNLIYASFLYLAIVLIGRRISQEKTVTVDTIRGGFCIYLFIGTLFFLLYQSISLLDSKAFFYSVERKGIYQLMYYSFTTLTTLGYGDIVPLNRLAMALCNMESIIGQLYPAVFIARLVSLYSVQDIESQD